MKKITLLAILITLLINIWYIDGYAAYIHGTYKDFAYVIDEGILRLVKYTGTSTDIVIPAEIDGYQVESIGFPKVSSNFCNANIRKLVSSVKIPDGVKTIGESTFQGCKSIKTINIPDSVETIGSEAFSRCESLTEITIPENVKSIGEFAFAGCTNLVRATISGDCIGDRMFIGCESLSEVNITGNVSVIGKWAFSFCYALKNLKLPDGVTLIDRCAFDGSGLEYIIIPESVEEIHHCAFGRCNNLKEMIIKNADTEFKEEFADYIPTTLGGYPTFYKTDKIQTIYSPVNSQAQEYCGKNALSFVPVANVEVNGEKLKTDVPPIIVNDRVLIPARAMFESLGAEIAWDENTRTVTALSAKKNVSMSIDKPAMSVNGITTTLDVAPQILMSRTLVPARAVSESFGADVRWDEARQTVVVTY